jgi:CNT family concentrative nucleoside transporter
MNKSEILCIMVGGMANTAGSVLAAYVGMLGGSDPASQQFFALHMLSQSIMSAPAAIVCSKILFPQTEKVAANVAVPKENIGDNMLDAISNGTTDGLKLAANVAAMLVVFTALMAVLNAMLSGVGSINYIGSFKFTSLNSFIASATHGQYSEFSLKVIFGYIFAPLAWVIGVHPKDILNVGQLLGEKTIINEFYAYGSLANMRASGVVFDPKSLLITTYALSGFANFASIGIQIGGISQLAPGQRKNLSELGLKALLGGTIACLMCACVAGMLHVK